MENLSYVTQSPLGPACPGFLDETFPPLAARSSYLQGVPQYFHPPRSLSTSQSTDALSSSYSFPERFSYTK